MQKGLVKKRVVANQLPTGMQGFGMNTRRAVFADPRVRQAMAWAFDFEWANKELFYGSYTRSLSYFSNSDLACSGIPAGAELALLEPYRAQLPPELFTKPFTLPVTDGSGNNRPALIAALHLLEQAGWTVQDRKLMKNAAGQRLGFEILLNDPAFERVTLPYVQDLKRLGIDVSVRTIDPSQYQQRMDDFDYDMTIVLFPESESRATSSGITGAPPRPSSPAATTSWASQAPWSMRWSSRSSTPPTTPRSTPLPTRSTACCSGAGMSCRNGISAPPVSPIGMSSAIRPSRCASGFDIDSWWIDETLARATNTQRHHSNEV